MVVPRSAWAQLAMPWVAVSVASHLLGQSSANLTWSPSTLAGAPSARAHFSAAGTGTTVLFGGVTATGVSDQSFTLDEFGWRMHPRTQLWPAARSHAAMCPLFYPAVLMFGGRDANGFVRGDTWWGLGYQWSTWFSTSGPPARAEAAMANLLGDVILFGGRAPATTFGDTWGFVNSRWSPIAPLGGVAPSPRYGHAMASLGTGTVVGCLLFGGRDAAGNCLDDTWIGLRSGAQFLWRQAQPTLRPAARAEHTLVYVGQRTRVQLFGGTDGVTSFADVHEWDGTNWHLATIAATQPAPRSGAALMSRYDPVTNGEQIVLFGGRDGGNLLGDAWSVTSTFPARCRWFATGSSLVTLSPQTWPWLGESIRFGLEPSNLQMGYLLAGFSNTTSPLGPLPLSLGPALNGAVLAVDPLLVVPFPFAPRVREIALPPIPAFQGIHLYVQGIALTSAGVWATSNPYDCELGWK